MNKLLLPLAILITALAGCIQPLKPGHATLRTATGSVYDLQQSENPAQPSTHEYERITKPDGQVITEKSKVTVGAAQKDIAREAAAKLSSLKGVVWVGILVFLFGAASAVYPPLKVLVGGSVTTSAVIAGSGVALIVLPSLLVGHELLILAVAGGAAALYFFAHRHGSVSSELKVLRDQIFGKK